MNTLVLWSESSSREASPQTWLDELRWTIDLSLGISLNILCALFNVCFSLRINYIYILQLCHSKYCLDAFNEFVCSFTIIMSVYL